jgi:2-haloacid dehalogenase
MSAFDPSRFRALSFDCYGTLIDWESGLLDAFHAVLDARAMHLDDGLLLETFAGLEHEVEAEAFQTYRVILTKVLERMGDELGFVPSADECAAFAGSVATWPPFADSRVALRRLAERFELIVLSNVDTDLFAGSATQLEVPFAHVFTAGAIGSYKPDPRNFEHLKRHAGVEPNELLHCAQSLFHDIGPAREAGLATVWVNRRVGQAGGGATPASAARPDAEVASLAELVELLLPT